MLFADNERSAFSGRKKLRKRANRDEANSDDAERVTTTTATATGTTTDVGTFSPAMHIDNHSQTKAEHENGIENATAGDDHKRDDVRHHETTATTTKHNNNNDDDDNSNDNNSRAVERAKRYELDTEDIHLIEENLGLAVPRYQDDVGAGGGGGGEGGASRRKRLRKKNEAEGDAEKKVAERLFGEDDLSDVEGTVATTQPPVLCFFLS